MRRSIWKQTSRALPIPSPRSSRNRSAAAVSADPATLAAAIQSRQPATIRFIS
ncbi:MAG TPA: hypothetical protein VF789_23690 [Thermoanaerobaculia bacterium]